MDGIQLRTANYVYYLRNDPGDDAYDGISPNEKCRAIGEQAPTLSSEIYTKYDGLCNFSKFVHVLHQALDFGLIADLLLVNPKASQAPGVTPPPATPPATNPPSHSTSPLAKAPVKKPAPSGSDASSGPSCPSAPSGGGQGGSSGGQAQTSCTIGYLCFNPGLAVPTYRKHIINDVANKCGTYVSDKTNFNFDFDGITAEVTLVFRSPDSIYKYLGRLVRESLTDRIHIGYHDPLLPIGEPFLNVVKGAGGNGDCFVSVYYDAQLYCVPRAHANNTAMILDILEQLRNLAISPSDLNGAVSVRLVN